MENKKNTTSVGIILLIYITLWSCNNNRIILYGGYAILMFFTLSKLFFSEKGAVIEIYKPTKQLFLFMCFCIASTFWALNKELAFQKIIFIVACVIMVIVMSNYFVRLKSVDSLIFTVAIMGIVMAVYVILFEGGISAFYAKATSSIGQANLNKSRVGGEINNVNFIGMQCGYSAVVLFYYALFKKKRYCYVLMLIPFIVSVASGSRKALILLFLGVILLYYFYQKKEKNIQKYLKVMIAIIVGVFVFRLILSMDIMYTISKRMSLFFESLFSGGEAGDSSSNMRLEMIKVGIRQFWNAPALGTGLGNSVVLNANKLNFSAYSHNDYIEHLVNGGLIGFLLYYRIFIYFIKNYLNIMKVDDNPQFIISYVLMLLVLILNFATVSYYNSMQMYLFFILWSSQIEIKKEEGLLK